VAPAGFRTWAYDTEEIVIGYFRREPLLSSQDNEDQEEKRPQSLFTFPRNVKSRSTVLAFPRGSPFRDPTVPMTEPLLIKSVWNIDMLLSLFSTCLQKGDVLCDLFAGTASASIAALLLGCDCVIVDHMKPHIHLCMQRINGHMNKMEKNMKRFRTLDEAITKSLSMDDVSDVDI
jgi:hypothetical protein